MGESTTAAGEERTIPINSVLYQAILEYRATYLGKFNWLLLRNCPNQPTDAGGHRHRQATAECHANCAHHYSCATRACSQSAHQCENCQRR